MITDLAAQSSPCRYIDTDVAIVGAGIAGLILAARLRRSRIRVAVLESGGLQQSSETHPLNKTVQMGDAYSGASIGRFRCLGGTSTRWGGALLPFLSGDLMERPHVGLDPFPIGMDSVLPYLSEAEDLFGIDDGSYEEEFVEATGASKHVPVGDPAFQTRFAKWPSFKRRNVANLFEQTLRTDREFEVVLNATVTKFSVDLESPRIRSLTGNDAHGHSVIVAARNFVVCAGAIESTRLLLLLDRQYGGRFFHEQRVLGHFFFDHISCLMAEIRPIDVKRLNHMAGFRFIGQTMRSLRFELKPETQKMERVGSANVHISFKTDRQTGFDALRELMRGRQRGASLTSDLFFNALRDLPYVAKLGMWRAVHHQLLWPRPASYELHVVAEQLPRHANRISLAQKTDVFGLPLAAIDWRILDEDYRTFRVVRRLFDQFWIRHGLQRMGELAWYGDADAKTLNGLSQTDVYHPGGSTRMGIDARSAVLDRDLRVFGISNLWSASTAAFPSGGGANPTLTLILFTLRLGEHLAKMAYH